MYPRCICPKCGKTVYYKVQRTLLIEFTRNKWRSDALLEPHQPCGMGVLIDRTQYPQAFSAITCVDCGKAISGKRRWRCDGCRRARNQRTDAKFIFVCSGCGEQFAWNKPPLTGGRCGECGSAAPAILGEAIENNPTASYRQLHTLTELGIGAIAKVAAKCDWVKKNGRWQRIPEPKPKVEPKVLVSVKLPSGATYTRIG